MPATRPFHRFTRFVACLLAVALLAAAVIFGLFWWQERPLARADAYLKAGEASRALEVVEGFLQERPKHSRGLALKARSLVALGRPAQAIDLFQRVGAADDREAAAWAQALVELKQWSTARPLLEGLLERDPDNPRILHGLAVCCMHLGDTRAAVIHAQRLSAVPGSEAQGYLLLGMIQYNVRNSRASAEAWRHMLRFAPDAAGLEINGLPMAADQFFLLYGRVELSNSRPDEARRYLERSLSSTPSAEGYALLGQACLQSGRNAEAVEAWLRALRSDRLNRIAREGLARAALEQDDAERAVEWLEPIASGLRPSSQTASLMERASRLLGNDEEAAQWRQRKNELREDEELDALLDQFVQRFPTSVWARAIQAHRRAQAGDWQSARALSEKLLAEAPDESFVRDLAEAVERRGSLPSLKRVPIHQHF